MTSQALDRIYDLDDVACFYRTKDKFGGLSNMAAGFPLRVNDIEILTSEALYQACRFPHIPVLQQTIISQRSPMAAKMKSKPRRSESRDDWDYVRVDIMRWCLRVKLAQHWDTFGELLRSTGDGPIVEKSRRDPFWGAVPTSDDRLKGRNILGRLLRQLRDQLKGPYAPDLHIVEPLAIPNFLLYGKEIARVDGYESPEFSVNADAHNAPADLIGEHESVTDEMSTLECQENVNADRTLEHSEVTTNLQARLPLR